MSVACPWCRGSGGTYKVEGEAGGDDARVEKWQQCNHCRGVGISYVSVGSCKAFVVKRRKASNKHITRRRT